MLDVTAQGMVTTFEFGSEHAQLLFVCVYLDMLPIIIDSNIVVQCVIIKVRLHHKYTMHLEMHLYRT